MTLAQKNILLIIGGGIAAYKTLTLIRRLRECGAHLQVIITSDGQKFVTEASVAALAGQAAHSDLFAIKDTADISHIRLARHADLIVIAPLTASRMAKMAAGLADDLAGAVLLATNSPILAAPAMNPYMWAHAATKRNLAQLRADGIEFIGPEWGEMAEAGEAGLGRMSEIADIIKRAEQILSLPSAKPPAKPHIRPLDGHHIIVTAGPTHEAIDPVRFLANRSSGKQGYAIAQALAQLGARVTLVSGPVALSDPPGIDVIHVQSACAMLEAVEKALPAKAAIFVAAVADWRVRTAQTQKIKKQHGQSSLTLELVQNPDILATIAKGKHRPQLVIGFAAETQDMLHYGAQKLHDKGADWIIANDVSTRPDGRSIMGGDHTQLHLISREGAEGWPLMSKQEAARRLAHKIAAVLMETGQ